MLEQLRRMRAESRVKTAGDQLRQILDEFEKGAGAEGSGLDQPMRDVVRDKYRDGPGIMDDAQITPQARQRVAEALQLHEAMSKKAEGEEPVEEPTQGAQIDVPAPEQGQAAADTTLEQIAAQYGLTTDEFLDFLSEESDDLEELGQEGEGEPAPGPEEAPGPDAAAVEENPQELYQDIAKESAQKIAAMKHAFDTPGWVAPAAIAGGAVGLGTLGALGGPKAWRALKNWRAGAKIPGAVSDATQAAKAVDLPPMPQKAFGTQVPEGVDDATRAAFQAKREAERADAIRTLGLSEGWNPAAVKQQFRQMIRSSHPDAGGSPEQAAALNKAYEILKNGSLRSRIKVAMLRRALAVEESFADRAQRLVKTGQLRLLNEW